MPSRRGTQRAYLRVLRAEGQVQCAVFSQRGLEFLAGQRPHLSRQGHKGGPAPPRACRLHPDGPGAGAVGESKCCQLFRRYFSQTPVEYLNRYRLDKSLALLRETDRSITEIALAVGFGGASYYAELFRRQMGQSPTEYRTKARNGG